MVRLETIDLDIDVEFPDVCYSFDGPVPNIFDHARALARRYGRPDHIPEIDEKEEREGQSIRGFCSTYCVDGTTHHHAYASSALHPEKQLFCCAHEEGHVADFLGVLDYITEKALVECDVLLDFRRIRREGGVLLESRGSFHKNVPEIVADMIGYFALDRKGIPLEAVETTFLRYQQGIGLYRQFKNHSAQDAERVLAGIARLRELDAFVF